MFRTRQIEGMAYKSFFLVGKLFLSHSSLYG